MTLKCSIFGHRFGDPVVERSRDESGSEVVITIQEIQSCSRCGYDRVVSENKEVTTLETPEELDESATEADQGSDKEEMVPEDISSEEAADVASPQGREPAIDEAESNPSSVGATPDLGGTNENSDDGVILEEDESEPREREVGAWPEEPDDDSPEWTPPTDIEEDGTDREPNISIEQTSEALTVPEGVFRCPSCGFSTAVDSSSLREGDFCPECHTGSLAHERGAE